MRALRSRLWAAALAFALLVAACAGSDSDAGSTPAQRADPTAAEAEPTPSPSPAATAVPAPTATPAPTPEPQPIIEHVLVPAGPAELVYDWSEDRCQDLTLPDAATRVVRGTDGLLRLYISNLDTFPMVGPDFDSLEIDCSAPVMTSDLDPDPSQFNDSEWIGATYTEDNETVYAIIHNEYLGKNHPATRPNQCLDNTFFNCIDVSLTLGISTDGGVSFRDAVEPPGHLIATMPYRFDEDGLPTGIWQPSNLIRGNDGYLYLLANVSAYPKELGDTLLNWICAMRTDDIADPTSWRYWDGAGFDGVFVNPYVAEVGPVETAETCARVDFPALSGEMSESIVWSDTLERYVIVGGTHEPGDPGNTAVYYSTSTDLIDWTPRRRLIDLPVPGDITLADTMAFVAYPTLLDHDSASPNFDTVDDEFHLYVTRFNAGTSSLDRDLLRYPIEIRAVTVEPSEWTFDVDAGGWQADNHIGEFVVEDGALRMVSTADDPYFSTTGLQIPAAYSRATVTMAVDGGDNFAQLFFIADNELAYSEETQIGFEVVGDGEMHTYDLDLSSIPAWDGSITALRFDPVTTADTTVRIDRIAIGP